MECKNSALCLFDKPAILTDIQRRYTVDYYPISTVTSNAPIEYYIPGNSEDYIDLNSCELLVKIKVTKADGTAVDQTKDFVALNNLAIATLFQDASLTIGETQIEGGDMTYAYKAYFKTVTQFTPAAQESHMLAMGWYKDEHGKFDVKTNAGFKKRQTVVGDSLSVEFGGPLYFDLFNQERPLISQTDMRIKLLPNKPEFALNAYPTTATDYKINFESVVLYVDRWEMNPSVINGHAKGLETQNAIYPINHSDVLSYTIPAGQLSYTKDRLFPDMAPKLLMVAMVENDAYNGDAGKNPFHFQHFNLNKIALYREGRSVPGQPFTPNFSDNLYLRSYLQTMESLKYFNTDDTNGLTPQEWAQGYTIYVFDLTAEKDVATNYVQANLSRNLRLELSFAKTFAKTINVLIYALTDSKIEITKLRDVITHYNR